MKHDSNSNTESQEERFFKTHPPRFLSESKVENILNYLAFSGTPIHLWIEQAEGVMTRVDGESVIEDIDEGRIRIHLTSPNVFASPGQKIEAAFGYKRKRAGFKSEIIETNDSCLVVKIPEKVSVTNLRRNPRTVVASPGDLAGHLSATTSKGKVQLNEVEIFEISQLGVSFFIERSDTILLPGDVVDQVRIEKDGQTILETAGVVNRVDLKRRSSKNSNSYMIVVIFQKSATSTASESNRGAKRYPVLDTHPCYFSAEHPLFPGCHIRGQVYEISTSGLSLLLEETHLPIVPGLRFRNTNLQLPHQPSRELDFKVVYVDFKSDGESSRLKIGGEFQSAGVELIKDISSYSQQVEGGLVSDIDQSDLDRLWEFMFETNFIYPNKRQQLQTHSKDILETYQRLLSKENPIVKKIVYKEDDEIKGHISAIKYFDQSWIIQHLNALKASSASAAREMISSITNYFYDDRMHAQSDNYYLISFYRPNNIYPAVFFGEAANRINDPNKSSCRDFQFGLLNLSEEEKPDTDQDIRIDCPTALMELTNFLIESRDFTLLRSFGLDQKDPLSLAIQDDYESLNLYRRRNLVSATDGQNFAIGLCEQSSPGLNLSELTNSIFLFTWGISEERQIHLTNEVLRKANESFYKPRGITPTVLQPKYTARSNQVTWSKIYTCWITAVHAVDLFEQVSREIVKDFRHLILKFQETKLGDNEKRRASA